MIVRQDKAVRGTRSIDESWLDVTHSLSIFGSAETISYLIKARIKHSFGITFIICRCFF
ncbi:MAG: hypothetical protein WCK54_02360 [Desulfuromonadales bacterium]